MTCTTIQLHHTHTHTHTHAERGSHYHCVVGTDPKRGEMLHPYADSPPPPHRMARESAALSKMDSAGGPAHQGSFTQYHRCTTCGKWAVLSSTSVTLVGPLSSHNLSDCSLVGRFQRSSPIQGITSVHPLPVVFCP